jgi:alpha-1,3-mannosyltransferase
MSNDGPRYCSPRAALLWHSYYLLSPSAASCITVFGCFAPFPDEMLGMKRIRTPVLQALVFLSVCTLIGRQYIRRHLQSLTDTQRHNINAVLDHATTKDQSEILTVTIDKVAEDDTSDNDGPALQITTASIAAETVIQVQSTPVVESLSPTETSTARPYTSTLTLSKDNDPELLREAPRYLQAIMDPLDTSFPRLSCPAPTHTHYDYLKTTSSSTLLKPKYFFALDLFNCAPLLPRLLGTIIETIRFLGPSNCALSIVEGRSHDGTYEVLHSLIPALAALNITYHFTTNTIDPKAGAGVDRIEALVILRKQALQPLTSAPENFDPDTTVLFINDVALCMEDVLELIHQRLLQKADMTCAMDWIFGGTSFYDVWVSRAMNGDQFFEIPQSGSWEFKDNLFWNHPLSKDRWKAKKPFQVFACWNGATAFTAKPVMDGKVKFRTVYRGKGNDGRNDECFMGEPTLFCKDMWHEGFGRIAVVPSVNVGYDDEESMKVKKTHGWTREWVEREEEIKGKGDTLIEWDAEPPSVVKCVPTYQEPEWVSWDQGLKGKKKGKVVR